MGRHIVTFSRGVLFSCLLLALSSATFAQTFTSGAITITNGTPSVYPSTISVSGLLGSVSKVTLTVHGLNDSNNFNVAYLVQSPGGANLEFWSGACATNPNGGTFTFDDAASGGVPNDCSGAGGTFKPTVNFADTFPSPGPGAVVSSDAGQPHGTATFANKFNGLTGSALNGTWKLYIANQFGNNTTGSMASWSLNFTVTGGGHPTATTINSNTPNPSFTSAPNGQVTFAVSVNTTDGNGPATNGTVTIHDVTTNQDLGSGSISSSGTANIALTITSEGNHDIYAIYGGGTGFQGSQASNHVTQTVSNHATNPSGTTFCNPGTITIPTGGLPQNPVAATPFPSSIVLGSADGRASPPSPGPGIIQKLTVSLNNINYADMQALGFILVSPGPNPKAYEFFSEVGGGTATSVVSITLDDDATGTLSRTTEPSTGSYKPASFVDQAPFGPPSNPDPYPAGAPTSFDSALTFGNVATLRQEFAGRGGDGTWQLFVGDRGNNGNVGTLSGTNPSGGWCLTFTMQPNGTATSTTLTSTKNPATPSDTVTITATISPNVANAGTVTFTDGVTTLASNVAVSGSKATFVINPNTLIEGTHHILAEYSGTSTGTIFGPSTGSINQRIDNVTPVPTISGSVYTYCNTGTITFPGGSAAQGPASPYPSNIFVSSLPGTVDATTLTLKSFTANVPQFLDSLVVGPTGTNLDFFSTEGGLTHVGPFDLTFDDNSTNILSQTAGTPNLSNYKPASANSTHSFPACPSNATDCQSPAIGPPAPTSGYNFASPGGNSKFGSDSGTGVFGGGTSSTFNGNGTWSLFQFVNNEENPDGTEAGWCVNLKENLPDISLTNGMTHSPTIFTRGQAASFTITVTNNGPGPTGFPTLTITDQLPTGLTFTSGTGTGWSCSATGTPQVVTCTQANPIAANSSSAVTINVSVGATTPDSINNSATNNTAAFPNGTGGDGTSNNNTASNNGIQVAGTLLTISKSHTDPFTQGQTNATYSITVKNTGADGTSTVGHPGATLGTIQVTDAMPTAFTITAVNGGAAWTCQPPASGVMCTLNASLPVGSTSGAIVVTVTVSNTANTISGALINKATLTATSDQIGVGDANCVLNNFTCFNDPTNIKQVPTQLLINSGNNQTATVNTNFTNPFSALVEDAGNAPVAGVNVTFTAPGTGPSATSTSNNTTTITVATDAQGHANASYKANTVAGGPYNVGATAGLGSPSVSTTINFSETNAAGAPASMTANTGTTPQSATVNTAFTNALAVTVKDAFGNLVPNASVTFTAPGSGASGTFSNNTATITVSTNSSGVASAPITANTTAGGPYTVTAATAGVTTVNFSLTNNAGAPASMTANAGTTPQSASINTPFTNALAVTVKDSFSNPVSGVNVTFTAPGSGASGTFSNSTATITVATNASGVASAPFTANSTVGGPYTVTAASAGLTTVNFALTNTAGAPASMTANAGTTPQSATINTAFTNALAVTIKDAASNPVPNVNVTFTAPGSGASGTFSNNTATITVATNASGVASATFTANAAAGGPYTVTAASAGLTTVNFALTNTVGAPASMTANAGTTPQSATILTAFTNALAVTIKDAGSNPVPGVNVTFTAPGSGASGTFSNSTATITVATNASGVASAPFSANATAGGPYTVTAASAGLTTVNFALTNTTGAASTMTANAGTTPQSAAIHTAFANALAVTVKDAGSNPVSGVSVTFTAPGSGASGTFSNNTATITVSTNAQGVASATFTANGTTGGPYTVTATSGGLTAVNFSLTNTVGTATSMTANAGTTPQSTLINTAFTNALAVTLKDAGNNPVPGVSVTFTAPGSGASGTFSNNTATITVATNASGVASATFTANGTAGGPYTVTAASAGLTTVNFSLTNTDTAPSVMSVTTTTANGTYGVNSVITINVNFNKPIVVNATGISPPVIPLNSSGNALYSGSGTSTVSFTYTVLAGQNSSHLDYTSSSAFTPGTYTITGTSGIPAILTLPAPGNPGSLSANSNIVIDTTAPTVVSYSVLFGNQSYVVGSQARNRLPWQISGIRVVFSKPIASADVNSLSGVATTGFTGLGTNTLTWSISPVVDASLSTVLAGSGTDAIKDAAGNGLNGGTGFTQAFKVLWADANDDGVVTSGDAVVVNNATHTAYNIFCDLNGDGVVDINDVRIVGTRNGTSLP